MTPKPSLPNSPLPRSTLLNFDISLPNDPHFQCRDPGPTSTANVDQEWKEERWYLVPPEVDSEGKPIFVEAGENEAVEGEELKDGRGAEGGEGYERKAC